MTHEQNAVLADISKNLEALIEKGRQTQAKLDELIEQNRKEIEKLSDQEQYQEVANRG